MKDSDGNELRVGSLVKIRNNNLRASVGRIVGFEQEQDSAITARLYWLDDNRKSTFTWSSWEIVLAEPEDLI